MTLLALLIWRCWVYTGWKCLPCFRRPPRVQSATHVRTTHLPLSPLIPSSGLVIRYPSVPLFLFTPTDIPRAVRRINHTWTCTTLNRVHFTPKRDWAL